ncbi:MAG: methyltransferase domain-containing protein [Magnetococcales bacterium]|nr:methyltransferase domain-containing protein [Magnetococcales bacterium]
MSETTSLAFFPVHRLDARRLRRNWQRAALSMAAEDGLLRRLDQALLERLEDIRLTPQRVLELGGRTGLLAAALQKKWPKAEIVSLSVGGLRGGRSEWRLPWQRYPKVLEGELLHLPFARQQFDLVISSMVLHWSNDLPAVMREIRRVLAPDRLLLFTVAGSASLQELNHCLAQRDAERQEAVRPRGPLLPSLPGLGDLLLASGFVLPVVDREQAIVPVTDVQSLWRQLQAMGSGNPLRQQTGGLRGRGYRERLQTLYQQQFCLPDGNLACTVEILFGHAWKNAVTKTQSLNG